MEQIQYKVCVRCATYNQSAYILDTLNGFVVQQTNFPYVVAVVDDASTDGEQEVIRTFVSQQFDTNNSTIAYEQETPYAHISYARHKTNHNCYIVVLYLKENHYSRRISKLPYLARWRDNALYEALCEGDDYWTDPHKLQKQVDYLDTHPQCGLVYAKAQIYNQQTQTFGNILGSPCTSFEQLLRDNTIPTLTSMYRMAARQGYNDFIAGQKFLMGDYPLWLYISMSHEIHFFDEVMCVYRLLENSASHSTDYTKAKQFLQSTSDIKQYFILKSGREELSTPIKEAMDNELFRLAWHRRQYPDVITYYHTLAPQYRKKTYNIKRFVVSYIRSGIGKVFKK